MLFSKRLAPFLVCLDYFAMLICAHESLPAMIYMPARLLIEVSKSSDQSVLATGQGEPKAPENRTHPVTLSLENSSSLTSTISGTRPQTSAASAPSTRQPVVTSSTIPVQISTSKPSVHSAKSDSLVMSNSGADSSVATATLDVNMNCTMTQLGFSMTTTFLTLTTTPSTTSTSNSIIFSMPTLQSNTTTSKTILPQTSQCPSGSRCAWKVGVGVSFGGALATVALIFTTQRYKRYLKASHDEHQIDWNNRRWNSDDMSLPRSHNVIMEPMIS